MDRTRCLRYRLDVLLTVWESETHKELGNALIRAATSTLRLTDAAGRTLVYVGLLDPNLEVTDVFSTAGQSLSVDLPWLSEGRDPIDCDLRWAVGEVALLWSDSTQIRRRLVMISGPVKGVSWGTDRDVLSLTVEDVELVDRGSLFPVDAELTSTHFPDIADEDGVAHNSDGYLPPRVYAPRGSNMYAPCLCVKDEVDAESGVSDLVPRRFLMGHRRPSRMDLPHQFRVLHPSTSGRWMAADDSTAYQATPVEARYPGGRTTYFYVNGEFIEEFGNASVDFTFNLDAVTATKTGNKVAERDQIRGASGATDEDWLRVDSVDGSSITLVDDYGGTSVTNVEGEVIRRPPDEAFACWHICTHGGDDSADGSGPICQVVDVILDILRVSRLSVPPELGDLETMRCLTRSIVISTLIGERVPPYDWLVANIFSLVPIRPYRSGGCLRFGWAGIVHSNAEIATTIDLDTYGPARRQAPVRYLDTPVFPRVRLKYDWHAPKEAFRATLENNGEVTGRALDAERAWGSNGEPPTQEVETSVIESQTSAGLISTYLVWRDGYARMTMTLEIGQELFWLSPGMVVRVTETGSTWRSALWRIEQRTVSAVGRGRLVLESLPD